MKSLKIFNLILILFLFCPDSFSQLWKEYSDSAKVFSEQNEFEMTLKYYFKAKDELKRDSMWTNTHAKLCNSLANVYRSLGEYPKAEPLLLEALEIRQVVFGKESVAYATSCNNLAVIYEDMYQYSKAEPLYVEVRYIRERLFGIESSEYALSCNNLGTLYVEMDKFEKAEPFYLEAINIREKILGKEHPDYFLSCINLGGLYHDSGQYDKAELLYIESKSIGEKVFGKKDATYAVSCNNLADLYKDIGKYDKAEPLYIEAKNVREIALGKEHPDYALSCNNLAALYKEIGQYVKSEALYIEAKNIREKVFGKDSPDYGWSCSNLADLYRDMGDFEKAEPLFLESKRTAELVFGTESAYYAKSCNNLSSLYADLGQYERAQFLLLEAHKIIEKVFGTASPTYATSCSSLGSICYLLGQFDKAESLWLEAKQIREKVLGIEHPHYALICDNLGVLYKTTGQYKKSESSFLEAKGINEKVLGKSHPDYALSCSNLGNLYEILGDYSKTEPLYLEAKNIIEEVLGKVHPYYTTICFNLANLYLNLNEEEKTNSLYIEIFRSKKEQLKKVFRFASEFEKQAFLDQTKNYENGLFSFYSMGNGLWDQGNSYEISLFNRNLVLEASRRLRNSIYYSGDTSVQNRYISWISSREQIAFWYSKPTSEWPTYVQDLYEHTNALEKELTVLSSSFKEELFANESTWINVQRNLKLNEAAVEFVEFNYFDGKRWTDSTYYLALVLKKDPPSPVLVKLFEKRELDYILDNRETHSTEENINAFYKGNTALYELTWKPLEKHLGGIKKIYFASAGNLFKLSFAALPVNDNQVLGDKYQLVQLNTTATVTDTTQSFITDGDIFQLYGGIKYDTDSATLVQAVSTYQSSIVTSRSLPDDLERGAGFQYLPGTQKEVEEIKTRSSSANVTVSFLSGTNATEESVKALTGKGSPSVLHIATHGFFFPDPESDAQDDIHQKFETSGKAFKQSDNPLFRSGLLFTGANHAWQGKPIEGIEDGILTAYEVSNMYLPNTKLVVLSACETALGDIQGSEGVYGLQRAFKMAGVKNLVMSLWKVPDAETAEFMQLFYKNMFDKQSINDAFYNAQNVMKGKYRNEPYKWAAWVLVR